MDYKKTLILSLYCVVFSQIETKNTISPSVVQRLKSQASTFFEKNIKHPAVHYYCVAQTAAKLFFEKNIQKHAKASWNYLDQKIQHLDLIVFSAMIFAYYGIHIIAYSNKGEPVSRVERISGGIAIGTAEMLLNMFFSAYLYQPYFQILKH